MPDKYQNLPGGPAIVPPEDPEEDQDELEYYEEPEEDGEESLQDRARQELQDYAIDKAKDELKKKATKEVAGSALKKEGAGLSGQAAKGMSKAAGQAIKAAGQAVAQWVKGVVVAIIGAIGWEGIVIILVIILLIVVIAISVAYIKRDNDGYSGNKKEDYVSAQEAEDMEIYGEFSALAGMSDDIDVDKAIEIAEKVSSYVARNDEVISNLTDVEKALQEYNQAVEEVRNKGTAAAGKKLVEKAAALTDALSNSQQQSVSGSGYASPVGNQKIHGFNNTLHGRSFMHPKSRYKIVNGKKVRITHDVFRGFSNPGTGDAVDIHIGKNKPLYAMFDGVVSKGNSQCAVLRNKEKNYEAWYCHVKNIVTGSVKAGDQIAKTNQYTHVHLEVWVNGKSIHTTAADLKSKKYSQKGRYLWDRIRNIFNF